MMDSSDRCNEARNKILTLLEHMTEDELIGLLEELESRIRRKKRQYPRIPCGTTVYFATEDRVFKSTLQNISMGGVFIKTLENFCQGQKILMTFSFPSFQEPYSLKGKIVRCCPEGIGVKFTELADDDYEILRFLMDEINSSDT